MTDMDARLERLEDLAAVERVRFAWARAVDESVNDGRGLAARDDLATTDYSWTFAGPSDTLAAPASPPPTTSSAGFARMLGQLRGRLTFSLAFLSGGIVDLDRADGSAAGTWVVWHPFTLDGRAWVLAGRSHDRFVRDAAGRWRLSSTRLEASLLAPWDVDWAQGA